MNDIVVVLSFVAYIAVSVATTIWVAHKVRPHSRWDLVQARGC